MGNIIYTKSTFKKYGWIREHPDMNTIYKNYTNFNNFSQIDLRSECPPVYNQGNLGSCTANALAGAYEYDLLRQKKPVFTPSRLFIYYNERLLEHTTNSDSGASLKDGLNAITKYGVIQEDKWIYDINKFTKQPSKSLYETAKKYKDITYTKLKQDIDHIRQALDEKNVIAFGFSVYESFESNQVAESGIMTLPNKNDKLLGGHAVLAVGYNDSLNLIIVRNSWGTDWGDKGYFYMPYDYIINKDLASDFWIIDRLEKVSLYPKLE